MDVVENGVVEQYRVLGDDADGGPEAALAKAAQVMPVDADGAAADIVEAVEQSGQGRFAGA
ncbi:hypothetical protein SDC9_181547 [bioreactor metagenome]|uniref:Uncharacterized protein n=1 Tax=bioreactor metagenome TaxID=1076179 RepID=A0A645H4Y1_9ZZZZ